MVTKQNKSPPFPSLSLPQQSLGVSMTTDTDRRDDGVSYLVKRLPRLAFWRRRRQATEEMLQRRFMREDCIRSGMGGDCRDFLSHNNVQRLSKSR